MLNFLLFFNQNAYNFKSNTTTITEHFDIFDDSFISPIVEYPSKQTLMMYIHSYEYTLPQTKSQFQASKRKQLSTHPTWMITYYSKHVFSRSTFSNPQKKTRFHQHIEMNTISQTNLVESFTRIEIHLLAFRWKVTGSLANTQLRSPHWVISEKLVV